MSDAQPGRVNEFMSKLATHQRRLYQYIRAAAAASRRRQRDAEHAGGAVGEFDQFDPASNFYAWASRIAYFQVLNYRRRNRRMVTVLDEAVFEQIAARIESQPDVLQARQEAMTRCAEKLGPADRLLLNLRYTPGATVTDIARQLGRPANSVCKSLGRIRRVLWDCVREELAARRQAGGGSS